MDKRCSLKPKLPGSLSESRARDMPIVNKCHHWTNSKAEYVSETEASGCHQATGTKRAGSTTAGDYNTPQPPCSLHSGTARWESHVAPSSPKIKLYQSLDLGGKEVVWKRLSLEMSVQFNVLKSWADGKGEDFQVKRKCCCKRQQDLYVSPLFIFLQVKRWAQP